jgi:O-antigen ligase
MTTSRTLVARPAAAPPVSVSDPQFGVPGPIVRLAFYLFVFTIPFEFPDRDFAIEIPTAAGALFLFTTIVQPRTNFGNPPWPARWFMAYLYLFLLSAAINGREHLATLANRASYWPEVLKMFFSLVQLLLVFWVGRNLMRSATVAKRALLVLVLACAVRAAMPFLGIATTVHTVETGGARLSAMGQNSNHSAMILSAGLIALLGLTYGRSYRTLWPRLVSLPIVALLAVAIADTGSRGGLVALALGIMAFMLRGGTLGARVRNITLAAFAIACVGVAAYQSDVMRNRFAETFETGTLTGRERIYPTVFQMFLERPLFGWGPANNKYELGLRLDERVRRRRGTHNTILEVLSATGLIAAIPFFVGTWLCFWAAWRAREGPDGSLPLALTITVMMSNMSGDWFVSPLYWLVLAYAVASAGYAPQPAPVLGAPGRRPLVPSREAV